MFCDLQSCDTRNYFACSIVASMTNEHNNYILSLISMFGVIGAVQDQFCKGNNYSSWLFFHIAIMHSNNYIDVGCGQDNYTNYKISFINVITSNKRKKAGTKYVNENNLFCTATLLAVIIYLKKVPKLSLNKQNCCAMIMYRI